MKYFEKRNWNLTSRTSPYTGATWDKVTRAATIATASHLIRVNLSSIRSPTTNSQELPTEDYLICVGFSALNEWEALAMLDTTPFLEPKKSSETAGQLDREPSQHTIDESASSPPPAQPPSHRRNMSGDSISISQALMASETSNPDFASVGGTPELEGNNSSLKSVLILRKRLTEYRREVTFRPLSPVVAEFTSVQGNTVAGIFVGSSDHDELFWFVLDSSSESLQKVEIEPKMLKITSCVMGIDFEASSSAELPHTLALTCQDGTVNLISFRYDESKTIGGPFTDISVESMIVDGPLTCIRLYGGVRVVAGSLCGYVFEMTREQPDATWSAPCIIAQGFKNPNGEEDCVMSVDVYGDVVFVGLLSGRLLAYEKTTAGIGYKWKWGCQLPHSIHGIAVIEENRKQLPYLLVTTRWSVHLMAPASREEYQREAGNSPTISPSLSSKKSPLPASVPNILLAKSRISAITRCKLT